MKKLLTIIVAALTVSHAKMKSMCMDQNKKIPQSSLTIMNSSRKTLRQNSAYGFVKNTRKTINKEAQAQGLFEVLIDLQKIIGEIKNPKQKNSQCLCGEKSMKNTIEDLKSFADKITTTHWKTNKLLSEIKKDLNEFLKTLTPAKQQKAKLQQKKILLNPTKKNLSRIVVLSSAPATEDENLLDNLPEFQKSITHQQNDENLLEGLCDPRQDNKGAPKTEITFEKGGSLNLFYIPALQPITEASLEEECDDDKWERNSLVGTVDSEEESLLENLIIPFNPYEGDTNL